VNGESENENRKTKITLSFCRSVTIDLLANGLKELFQFVRVSVRIEVGQMDVFAGCFSILVGVMICLQPMLYSQRYGHTLDFTGYNIPLGTLLIIFGILAIWSEVRKRIKQRKEKLKREKEGIGPCHGIFIYRRILIQSAKTRVSTPEAYHRVC
jgi:uncharacterized membrane protein HdeD (DUF308 family)